jgi:hypothetical protein
MQNAPTLPAVSSAPAFMTTAPPAYAYPVDPRLGDFWDRRRTFGNVYTQPMWPWSAGTAYQPMVTDARIGDCWDRRRCFGNINTQPLVPWSGQPPVVRLGDSWDRRYTFGNIVHQPLVPPAGPIGPALGYHYADSAYRTVPTSTTVNPGMKDNFYTFA